MKCASLVDSGYERWRCTCYCTWPRDDVTLLTGREHLAAYVNYDDYEAATTTTQPGDDDIHHHLHLQQPSTSRLYDKPAAAAGADVIDRVMECNQLTQQKATLNDVMYHTNHAWPWRLQFKVSLWAILSQCFDITSPPAFQWRGISSLRYDLLVLAAVYSVYSVLSEQKSQLCLFVLPSSTCNIIPPLNFHNLSFLGYQPRQTDRQTQLAGLYRWRDDVGNTHSTTYYSYCSRMSADWS